MSDSDFELDTEPEESFEDWAKRNIDLGMFPDPFDFMPVKSMGIDTPEKFVCYWKENYNQVITGFRMFGGVKVMM